MPKKSINQNDVVITSNRGTDEASWLIGLSTNNTLSVSASDVSSSGALGGYLGGNVQVNLDDLTSAALQDQPPRIGYPPITYSNRNGVIASHDGRPDWGGAKINDNPPWKTIHKKWAEERELPHKGVGVKQNDSVYGDLAREQYKYINEDGVYDVVALSYRDDGTNSYYGITTPTTPALPQFSSGLNIDIRQAVPRRVYNLGLNDNTIYPFLHGGTGIAETQSDIFNSATGLSIGFTGDLATASLGVKNSLEPSLVVVPSAQVYDPLKSYDLLDATSTDNGLDNVGLVVSGILFPADRGTLALIRFPSDEDGVSGSILTPAASTQDVLDRVVAAINLGQGVGLNDGQPGGALFNNLNNTDFPSRLTGQYDLYELHTGNYIPHSTRSGAIGGLTGDKTKGQVRLLSDPMAFNISSSTITGGLPVLFSPYVWDTTSGTQTLKQDRNFLSYRLPLLSDYSPTGLKTPPEERDRFYVKNRPNKEEYDVDYYPTFDTAGGYLTFGEVDNYSYQVARYRHVVTLIEDYIDHLTNTTGVEGESNFGSFALIHFKTEAAFERLVRDGIAPSDEEVYSKNLISYSDIKSNIGYSLGTSGNDGLLDSSESYERNAGLSIFRPNVSFERRALPPVKVSISHETKTRSYHPSVAAETTIDKLNSYFMFVSGVIYTHPTTHKGYTGHAETRGVDAEFVLPESIRYSRMSTKIGVWQQTAAFFGGTSYSYTYWDGAEENSSSPFATIRPLSQVLLSEYTAQDNLYANSYEYLNSDPLASQFEFYPKHQQMWITLQGFNGELDPAGYVFTEVLPTGDAPHPITDLSLWDKKDGLCVFSSVGGRASVLVNNPYLQHSNLGVDRVADSVEYSNIAKVLYHSSRKVSLLELYGHRLSPQGTTSYYEPPSTTGIDTITSVTYRENPDFPSGAYIWGSDGVGIVYNEYNQNFKYVYLWIDWATNPTYPSPKAMGQSFAIYRYDEEGYKVYQDLELLPVGGDVDNGYALEACAGWDWVDSMDADLSVPTSSAFRYPVDRPIYRPLENSSSGRTTDKTHADGRFLAIKGVTYYIEVLPSIDTSAHTNPLLWNEVTQVLQARDETTVSAADDLCLGFSNAVSTPASTYYNLYYNYSTVPLTQVETLISDPAPSDHPSAIQGAILALRKLFLNAATGSFTYTATPVANPHPYTTSVNADGTMNYGYRIVEIVPSGSRQLPEYGNLTMDTRGFISVCGVGNPPTNAGDDILAVSDPSYARRVPLRSLFTLRKDTQERFLDESYRVESLFTDMETDSFRYNSNMVENLRGPGLAFPTEGENIAGYIAFPVRDDYFITPSNPQSGIQVSEYQVAPHGKAGYLRNSLHLRRIDSNFREAQVMGFPNSTRNLLSGSKYGCPPRGVLVYPFNDFEMDTSIFLGEDLASNTMLSANRGFHTPNSEGANPNAGDGWIDDLVAEYPILRHAQPQYNNVSAGDITSVDVNYVRAFDANFGKDPRLTPQHPYWNKDWTEATTGGANIYRSSTSAQNYGLIEQNKWNRVSLDDQGVIQFAPLKLRLVGVDWDMISYVDPNFPLQRRDGYVHEIGGELYLMRKRVMRVFVKVPGLTTWLDAGVVDGTEGESYLHYDANASLIGGRDPNGSTNEKSHPTTDGAGCCVRYEEKYLPEEGVVCLDLDLNVGFIPAFNNRSITTQDTYLGISTSIDLRYDNTLSDSLFELEPAQDGYLVESKRGSNNEAPILVKVILSDPEYPKYEVNGGGDLLGLGGFTTYPVGDLGVTIKDIKPAPNKSYIGHSYPADDRSPTWTRRGLMGIEVLRPDGSNYDYDQAIARPDFCGLNLHEDVGLHYWKQSGADVYEWYQPTLSNMTNKIIYSHEVDAATRVGNLSSLTNKGEG